MGDSATEVLLNIVQNEPQRIFEAAYKYGASPRGPFAGTVSPEDGMQMCSGFIAALTESLKGTSDEVRTAYLETLTPAFIAQGDSVCNAVYWNAGFMSALTAALLPAVPAEATADAADWLAHWAGRFVADVARVANETAAGMRGAS
jgi:hypothetical protein